jgi:hypothetical protein
MWQRTLWLKNFARHHRRARSDTGYILRLVAILTPMEVWICSARGSTYIRLVQFTDKRILRREADHPAGDWAAKVESMGVDQPNVLDTWLVPRLASITAR